MGIFQTPAAVKRQLRRFCTSRRRAIISLHGRYMHPDFVCAAPVVAGEGVINARWGTADYKVWLVNLYDGSGS